MTDRPILFVDVDGVISLFGFAHYAEHMPGPLHWIDGIAHCIPPDVGGRLGRLAERFALVWATGWQSGRTSTCRTSSDSRSESSRTRLRRSSGVRLCPLEGLRDRRLRRRPSRSMDRRHVDDVCTALGRGTPAPTLIVRTDPALGLTDEHVEELLRWAEGL